MDSVYIETTVVGHIAGRIHRDPLVVARQQITRDWWRDDAPNYIVFISQLVLDECSDGDPLAAAERLEIVKDVDLIESSDEVDTLADALIAGRAVPASEPRDAFHIAISAVNGVNYLMTWNFKHIANASLRSRIEQVCRDAGFEPPIICTPDELMGIEDGS
ncbi:MAG: type II toxin-antitoxin system VapC family toxin [Planctomycetota bacterium]|nr:type II toxin-antitoxin system VapC family toxin [Planctomycetota bacterium]